MLELAGLGESPLVVRVRRGCRRFVVAACRLVYLPEVEDSCFVKACRKHLTVLVVACTDCRVEVGLVVGMEDSAGRNSRVVRLAVKNDRVGCAGCRSA